MLRSERPVPPDLPWDGSPASWVAELSFATLWVTGPDPASDAVFRLRALRAADGETFDAFVRRPDEPDDTRSGAAEAASARMAREHGVYSADLEHAEPLSDAAARFLAFLGRRPVVVADRAAFEGWIASLAGTGEVPMRVFGLADIAAVLTPGRLASAGEGLAAALLAREPLARRPRALAPEDLRDALALLVARVLALDGAALGLLAHGYADAWDSLRAAEPESAAELAFALALAETPSAWHARDALFSAGGGGTLEDGRLAAAYRAHETLSQALESARPPFGRQAHEERTREPTPTVLEGPRTLERDDQRRVDEIFQEHLPRLVGSSAQRAACYREGQHAVAREIARGLGEDGLLLVHAPTGTGKTLAYLVPAMLFALRNHVRVGVATYTRALQEQATDREVPLALELLRRAGVAGEVRVALLKGRENYLCWRAVKLQAPQRQDPAYEKLAWVALALFALTDPEGDLDRLPQRPPLALERADRWRRALARVLAQTRSAPGCCTLREDREDCGGQAARRRAERAHVIITNHAFALSRREFFRFAIFDECEHLHAQAHSAFSTAVSFRALRELLSRLHKDVPSRAPLNRIRAVAIPDSPAAVAAEHAVLAQGAALAAASALQRAVDGFKLWRDAAAAGRNERDLHSLFREYVEADDDAVELLAAHAELCRRLGELGVALTEVASSLEALPPAGLARVRRVLDMARADLEELAAGVGAWIPRDEHGAPAFRRETFYDVETTPRGHDVMAARVLLPHEHLGRLYFPDLSSAALISATTWLAGGFDAASRYLGCHRAANPDEREERAPTPLCTFRAPDAFDYGRVLVAAPRDAPDPSDKRAALLYLARFVGFLAERTRGRILALLTNADDCARAAALVEPFLAARRIPFWYQRMEGAEKEELAERFRAQVDSVLFGLDTFWYGADFPGETLEYLILARLPYGVPDRYHHAQSAVLGPPEQRRTIYMPRALAKFRQGFGRLMRKETDRGCVFVLDPRIHDARHRAFLRELPLRPPDAEAGGAAFIRGDTDRSLHEAFAHMAMLADIRRRALEQPFADWRLELAERLPLAPSLRPPDRAP